MGIKIKFRNLPVIMMYVLGLLMVAIVEMLSINQNQITGEVDVTFSLQNLMKSAPSLTLGYVAIALYTAATIIQEVDKFKTFNEDYLDFRKRITDFSRNDYSPVIFNKYCAYINRTRKINAYKIKMHGEWRKLEKHQKDSDYKAWLRYQDTLASDPDATTTNKYCLRRERLEAQSTDEYIEANIDRLDVKYDKINASVILCGVAATGEELTENEYITKYKAAIVVRDRAPAYLMSLAILAVISSIGVDAFNITMHWTAILLFVLKMFSKVYAMVNAIYSTIKYAKDYNERVTMKDIMFRYGVCTEHNIWVAQEIERQKKKKEELENEQNNHLAESERRRSNDATDNSKLTVDSRETGSAGEELSDSIPNTGQLAADNVGSVS